jgi:hypothetical protein
MNERIENCLYQAGLTAQGCWDELDDYAREGIEKFAQLIVRECAEICLEANDHKNILRHFGVEA